MTRLGMGVFGVCCAAVGAMLGYFLDPRVGRRRRHTLRDRAFSRARRTERRLVVAARRTEWRVIGAARGAVSSRLPHERPDDVTLAHKVESALFRDPRMPKGSISINAEDGVVFLRGAVEHREDIQRLEEAARGIEGVRAVENLLHVPGTPAPTSRSKLERQRASH
jgi:osmotically-inducible protein OsmY